MARVSDEAKELARIEDFLKTIPMPACVFLKRASVAASTWARIKSGESIPNGATMYRIRSTFDIVKAEAEKAKSGAEKKGRK